MVDGRLDADNFQVVSAYIHLNPARAGRIGPGQERLKGHRWSSYPWYMNRPGQRPKWLSIGQLKALPKRAERKITAAMNQSLGRFAL